MHSYQLFLFTEFNSLVFHGYRTPGVCYDITFHPQSINISVKHWERNKIVFIFVGIRFPLVLWNCLNEKEKLLYSSPFSWNLSSVFFQCFICITTIVYLISRKNLPSKLDLLPVKTITETSNMVTWSERLGGLMLAKQLCSSVSEELIVMYSYYYMEWKIGQEIIILEWNIPVHQQAWKDSQRDKWYSNILTPNLELNGKFIEIKTTHSYS